MHRAMLVVHRREVEAQTDTDGRQAGQAVVPRGFRVHRRRPNDVKRSIHDLA